jgi:hypothetical protein
MLYLLLQEIFGVKQKAGRAGSPPMLPSEPFCHALNEVSPRPGEPDHDKDLL